MSSSPILTRCHSWTGNLASLVEQVDAIQSALGLAPPGAGPNVRLIRHYQTIGCVGKPTEREGTAGVYGYRHLLEAVAVRVLLADGWKLTKIGEVLAGLDIGQVEQLISARGGDGTVAYASMSKTAEAEPHATAATTPDAADDALALIAKFKQSAGIRASPSANATRAVSTEAYRPPSAPRQIAEFTPAPWLRLAVDEQALARAEPGAVLRAISEAVAILHTFKR